jgi:uncharacterized membrane protein
MLKQTLPVVLGVIFVAAGALHFLRPAYYVAVMPAYFPLPLFWVLLSSVLEVAGGAGLLLKRFRRRAAQGLALLMVAFMPVHLHMLFYPADVGAEDIAPYLLFWRVALQFVFIAMFVWLAEDA